MTRRIRTLDPAARVVHQDGSHQKWRLHDGGVLIVPIHHIERMGERSLGSGWLVRRRLDD